MASPSPQEFALLAPFGTTPEDKWFRTAYKYDRAKIFEWMEKKAETEELKRIYGLITSLSLPDGKLYKDTRTTPYISHIARKLYYSSTPIAEKSLLIVSGWTIGESTEDASAGKQPDWWSPYDLLGLFLSLLGPAPPAADKNNFYLPLTAVYARWCSRIAGRPDEGKGDGVEGWKPSIQGEGVWPFVFQCTWHTIFDENTKQHSAQYFLGASTGGDEFNKDITGLWKEEVQEARFNMLFACQKVSMVEKNWYNDEIGPNFVAGGSRTPFGNCGETYPFAIRFSGDKTQNGKATSGLALKRQFMLKEEYPEYDEHRNSDIWKDLMNPCPNCRELIERAGGNVSNFARTLDKNKAPPKPKTAPK